MLTDAKIKAAIKAVATEVTLNDKSEGRGAGSLLLVVRRLSDGTASATWFAKVKRDGKRTKRTLGRYPDVSLSMARQMMREDVTPQLRAGHGLRVPTGDRPTVAGMFAAFVVHLRAAGRHPDYASEVERMLLTAPSGSAADALGRERPPAEVTPAAVAEYVRGFFRSGSRGAADKARAYVSAAFGWAIKAAHDPTVESPVDWGVDRNPVEAVRKDPDASQTVDRALTPAEMRALWKATAPGADGFSMEVAACIRLVLCIGQRVQETLRIDGREIDLEAGLWNMPRHKTKLKLRPHTIPLPRQAVDVLRQLVDIHGDGPLFPSRTKEGERIEHRSVRQAITRWLELPGATLPKFTPRDLRRTWKSRAGDGAKIDKDTRDLIQQHSKSDTGSRSYDRADYLPVMREAMDRWQAWLDEQGINELVSSDDSAVKAAA